MTLSLVYWHVSHTCILSFKLQMASCKLSGDASTYMNCLSCIFQLPESTVVSNFYFILYSENQCISKLNKIGIFIDMKFH